MNHYIKSKQKGFVLLVTVTVLMGLLAIVSALVRTSKAGTSSFDEDLGTYKANLAEQNANQVMRMMTRMTNPAEMSPLQRMWCLPGSRSIPLIMQLNAGITAGTTTVSVKDIIPWFMLLAGAFDDGGNRFKLAAAKNHTVAIGSGEFSNISGMALTGNKYVIIEDELIRLGTNTRGVAGVKRSHPADSQSYTVLQSVMQLGVLRIGSELMKISDYDANADSFTVSRGEYGSTADSHSADALIEFYPVFPGIDLANTISGFSIHVSNEQSRFNINGLTAAAFDSITGDTLGATLGATILNNITANNRPMMSLLEAVDYTNDEFLIQDNQDIFTFYSEPSVFSSNAVKMGGTQADNTRVRINGTTYLKGNDGAVTVETSLMPLHPINVNEASSTVLSKLFSRLGIAGLATTVENYRGGGDSNYYNGPNDPFDGTSGVTDYGSAAEEFRATIKGHAGITNAQVDKIMEHVYAESFGLNTVGADIAPLICFTAGDVWRIKTNIVVGDADRPFVAKKSEMVFKPNPNLDGTIVLSSAMGWNEKHSTFYSVTRRQPEGASVATRDDSYIGNHFGPNMQGYNHNGGVLKITKVTGGGASPDVLVDLNDAAGFAVGEYDFGIRPMYGHNAAYNNVVTELTADFDPAVDDKVISLSDTTNISLNDFVYIDGTNLFTVTAKDAASITIDPPYASAVVTAANPAPFTFMPNYETAYYDISGAGGETITSGAYTPPVAADGPFYETSFLKEGGTFTAIRWTDSRNVGGVGAGPNVSAYYFDGTNWTEIFNQDSGAINVSNFIRLRFVFNNGKGGTNDIIPHLYRVEVDYTMDPDAPRRIVYMRR